MGIGLSCSSVYACSIHPSLTGTSYSRPGATAVPSRMIRPGESLRRLTQSRQERSRRGAITYHSWLPADKPRNGNCLTIKRFLPAVPIVLLGDAAFRSRPPRAPSARAQTKAAEGSETTLARTSWRSGRVREPGRIRYRLLIYVFLLDLIPIGTRTLRQIKSRHSSHGCRVYRVA